MSRTLSKLQIAFFVMCIMGCPPLVALFLNQVWPNESLLDLSLLTYAVVCAVLYGGVIAVLLYNNPKNSTAWMIAVGAILFWPAMILGSLAQLLFVIPMATVFLINGVDISVPLSRTAIRWAMINTIAFMAILALFALVHDSMAPQP